MSPMTAADPPPPDTGSACATYVELLGHAQMRDAVRLMTDLAATGLSLEQIVTEVLVPAQVEVGRRWEQGRWSVAQEHTATGITEIALQTAVLATGADRIRPGELSLVLACADGEWHALSARMAGEVLRSLEVDVTYVGASLPVEALGEYLTLRRPIALGLSCSTAMTLVGARGSITQAHEAGVPVLVAGSAFGRDGTRAAAIGADGWVATPRDAVALLERWRTAAPDFGSAIEPESGDWERLAGAPSEVVDEIMLGLLRRRPRLRSFSESLTRRLHKEAAYLLRCCAGVLLTADRSMLEDHTVWLRGVLAARRVPPDVLDDLYAAAAETLARDSGHAAAMVDACRSLLVRPPGDQGDRALA